MPRIPLGSDVGLGQARFQKSVSTPALERPVPQEVGPKREVYPLDVFKPQVAPLAENFKPVLPSSAEYSPIQQGLENLSAHAERIQALKDAELRQVNDAAEKTKLLVTIGDQKAAYQKDTLDIINNPDMTDEDKAKALQKREDDFKGIIGKADPKYQPVVASEVMGTIGSVKAKAQDAFLQNKQDSIRSDIQKRKEQLILGAASTGDTNGALQQFDALAGAYRNAGVSDAARENDRWHFEQTLLQNDIMGHLKTVDYKTGQPALNTVNDLLARLNETDENKVPKNWTRLDPATRNADVAAVLQKKHQIEADIIDQGNQQLSKLHSDFSMGLSYYKDALKNGDPVDPKVSVALRQQAQAMLQLDPDKSTGVMGLLQLQQTEQQYGPAYRTEQAAKDPLFGSGVRPISFQDLSSPEALQAKFADNIQIGRTVQAQKNLTFVPVLRNADMEGIAKTIESAPANGIVLIGTLKQALGNDGANSLTFLAGQMANSKDPAAPAAAAIIYNVAKGDVNTARVLASGMEVMRNKSIAMPKDQDLRDNFDRMLGNAMAENSANRGVNFEAYKTAYAALAARQNITDGSFDRDTAKEAFNRVVGTVTSWNGSSVLVPDGMDESKFRDYLNAISPESVQAWGGIHGMTNEKAADFIRDDATLHAVSPGRYSVEYEGKQAITTNGRPFIIDANKPLIKPIIEPAPHIIWSHH